MPAARPLPAVIGQAENVLRGLLTKILSTTRIKTYSAWVITTPQATQPPQHRADAGSLQSPTLLGLGCAKLKRFSPNFALRG